MRSITGLVAVVVAVGGAVQTAASALENGRILRHGSSSAGRRVGGSAATFAAPSKAAAAVVDSGSGSSGAKNINQAFSEALVNPTMGPVADSHFSALLMSAIEASGERNIPVIQLL
ncbi:hypothetical protein H4S06_003301 [Coemansia sp. BCRC 34490]|nr:hypothetical protein LPJ72_001455 [Coemansia sp. Benny D160-2]KAJ2756378.1 hypothetical protein H4S06_003301 [Coemansia sp. BCRC 34490]